MKAYLIRFQHEVYCQGYEEAVETLLVYANSYAEACYKIEAKYEDAQLFENLTIE